MSKRAFTMPELVLALVLASIVSTAVVRLTVNVLRGNRVANDRVQIHANLRTAMAFLKREFRPLSATGLAGSDIIEANDAAIKYRSMQGLYIVCASETSPAFQLVVRRATNTAFPSLNGASDSVFVLDEGDAIAPREARWLRFGVLGHSSNGVCADGLGGDRVLLSGMTASEFQHIAIGAPVRDFVIKWLRLYRDSGGRWWLGGRQWSSRSGWSRTQPIAGPFESDGVRFTYLDRNGIPTTRLSGIARVGIRLVGAPSDRAVAALPGAGSFAALESQIALRNNAR